MKSILKSSKTHWIKLQLQLGQAKKWRRLSGTRSLKGVPDENKLLQIKLEVQLSSEKVTSQQWKSKWEMHLNMKDPKKPQMTLWTLQKYWREVQIWYLPSFVFVFGSVSVYFFICLSVSHPQRTKRQASFVHLSFCPSIQHLFPDILICCGGRNLKTHPWVSFYWRSLFFFKVFPTFYENFRLGGVCVSPM